MQKYILDNTLNNDTPDGDNGFNDNNHDGLNNKNHDSDGNNDDDDSGDLTITIFQTMHFREPLYSDKPKFLALTHVSVYGY